MNTFDQRGQNVKNQTNIAGDQLNAGRDINQVEGDMNVYEAIGSELNELLKQVEEAAETGDLDKETALDVELAIKKAKLEAEKESPDKKTLLEHLDSSKTLMDKVTGISKSAVALASALGAAYAKFTGLL